MRPLAALAEHTHQSLRQHELHAVGDQIRLKPEIQQPKHARDRVLGVDRREHQMPRHRGLHRHAGRLRVANLADKNHVRVLPKHGPQQRMKRVAPGIIDGHLRDTLELVLDRVLDCHDVPHLAVDLAHRVVKRRRLPRARWTAHQQKPRILLANAAHTVEHERGHPDVIDTPRHVR